MSKPAPKVTNVYPSMDAGLREILDAAAADEPQPTARAAELVEEAHRAGPVLPGVETLPTVAGGGGGDGELVDPAAGAVTPRESAENLIELGFALVPAGDWQPENDAEREELVRAVERVFIYRNIAPNLPPELALLAVLGKYGRKRMAKPAVRSKLGPWLARMPLLGKLMGAGDVPGPDAGDVDGGNGTFGQLPRMTAPHDARE